MEKTVLLKLMPIPVSNATYEQAIRPCRQLAISRSERYGNSVDIMKTTSILDLILMKLSRTRELSESDPKYYDEIIDSINYLVFILIRKNAVEITNESKVTFPTVINTLQNLCSAYLQPNNSTTADELIDQFLTVLDHKDLVQLQQNCSDHKLNTDPTSAA